MKAILVLLYSSLGFLIDAEETKQRDWSMSHATLKETQESYDLMPRFRESLTTKSAIEVFEGLPHPLIEAKALAAESKRGISFADHGFLFYSPERKLTAADASAVIRTILSERSFCRLKGFAWCGGFHPDFLINLGDGDAKVTVQICFGCGEARLFKSGQIVHCNMTGEGETILNAILEDYYLERPGKKVVEQAGADQPATAPELKSEGKDKPQPESKVRPR